MDKNDGKDKKTEALDIPVIFTIFTGILVFILTNKNMKFFVGIVAAPFAYLSIIFILFAIPPIFILIRARKKIKVTIPQKVLAAACILVYVIFVIIAATANHYSKINGYSFRYDRLIGNMMSWGIVTASIFLLLGSFLAIDIIVRTQAIKYKKIGLFCVVMSSLFAQPIPFISVLFIITDLKTTSGGMYNLFLYSSMGINRFIIIACAAMLDYLIKQED